MMKYRIFIFIYSGNECLLPGLVRNVQWAFPDVPVHLIDDASSPVENTIFPEGVFYEQSSFNRLGNLNGPECIRGELDVFMSHLKMDETLVKIDPDTVFYSPGKMREYIEAGGFAFVSTYAEEQPFSGYFYLIHASVLAHVVSWIKGNAFMLQSAPEDTVICSTALACARMLRLPTKTLFDYSRGGFTGAFDHSVPPEQIAAYIDGLRQYGMWFHTLGNPGISKEQIMFAQQEILFQISNNVTISTKTITQ